MKEHLNTSQPQRDMQTLQTSSNTYPFAHEDVFSLNARREREKAQNGNGSNLTAYPSIDTSNKFLPHSQAIGF